MISFHNSLRMTIQAVWCSIWREGESLAWSFGPISLSLICLVLTAVRKHLVRGNTFIDLYLDCSLSTNAVAVAFHYVRSRRQRQQAPNILEIDLESKIPIL